MTKKQLLVKHIKEKTKHTKVKTFHMHTLRKTLFKLKYNQMTKVLFLGQPQYPQQPVIGHTNQFQQPIVGQRNHTQQINLRRAPPWWNRDLTFG